MIFRCTGSLMRTSELLSLCVEQKFLLWWAPYWRTVGSGVRSPSVAVFQLDAADSYSRSVSICIPGQFISLLLFLSFLLISVYLVFLYLSGFSPFYPQSHSLSSSCFAQSVSFTPQIHQQSYCTAGPPFSVPLSSQPFRADVWKIMTIEPKEFPQTAQSEW